MSTYDIWTKVDRLDRFTVTQDHLNLLRRAYVGWDEMEFGAPAISGKRPYGNSDVLGDIAEIVLPDFVPPYDDEDAREVFLDDHREELTRLHVETGLALQIALATGEFRTGDYVRDRYGNGWTRAGDEHGREG
jgi:hypothetical protein